MIGRCWIIDRTRNKIPGKKSQGLVKRELIRKKGKVCYICSKEVPYVELEHIVPVCVGGSIVNDSNLDLVCLNCHKGKTIIDKKIFNLFKRVGLVTDERIYTISFIEQEKLMSYYKEFLKILKKTSEVRESYEGWDDYKKVKKIKWEGNRQ